MAMPTGFRLSWANVGANRSSICTSVCRICQSGEQTSPNQQRKALIGADISAAGCNTGQSGALGGYSPLPRGFLEGLKNHSWLNLEKTEWLRRFLLPGERFLSRYCCSTNSPELYQILLSLSGKRGNDLDYICKHCLFF